MSNDENNPTESAMLPAQVRGQSPEVIDAFVAQKLQQFKDALEFSDAQQDPIRAAIALENLKLAIDPRIDQAEVRSRSTALLNTIKVLGMDRDMTKVSTDKQSVESALQKLREAADRGIYAAGRTIQSRVPSSSEQVSSGQEVLLRQPPERGERKGQVGPVRGTFPDTGKDSGRYRQGSGRGTTHEIDYSESEAS